MQQPWQATRPICRTLTQVPRHTLSALSASHSLPLSRVLLPRDRSSIHDRELHARTTTNVKHLDVKCNLRHAQQLPDRNRLYYRLNIFPIFTPLPVALHA